MAKSFKDLVLGNAGKKNPPNPLKKGRKKKGKWGSRPVDAQGKAYPIGSIVDLSDIWW
jgi:hypothetical protein